MSHYNDNISELGQLRHKELESDNDLDQDDNTSQQKPPAIVSTPDNSTEKTSAQEWIILDSTGIINFV